MNEIINRISTIFKERYGTNLNIQWTQEIKGKNPVFLSHWQNAFVYSRTLRQVSFPLFNEKNELQAIAIASPVENKDAIIFDEMASFLQLTLSEHMKLTQKNDELKQTEEILHLTHDSPSNILRFKNKKSPELTHFQFKKPTLPDKVSSEPLWISGDNPSICSHIAFSVHDWISNWAFINANEIPDLIWQDKSYWKNFPQITIFIPNIDDLSSDKLCTLKDNLKELNKTQEKMPLIIVTSKQIIDAELEDLKVLFKHYKSNQNVAPRAQAHFLLFNYKDSKPWSHLCKDTGKVFFLPFSQSPDNLH